MAETKGRFVDVEFVGIDSALHDVLTKPIDAGYEDYIAKAGLGIKREGNAA